jgi:hypothetical protein
MHSRTPRPGPELFDEHSEASQREQSTGDDELPSTKKSRKPAVTRESADPEEFDELYTRKALVYLSHKFRACGTGEGPRLIIPIPTIPPIRPNGFFVDYTISSLFVAITTPGQVNAEWQFCDITKTCTCQSFSPQSRLHPRR